ncbi:antitoxin [Nonomuraea sp. NPDC059194]|uniref:antitoxin n=1 Tax=Nonomuraea sp. NPDC059194 TaxID=3346764 RepID=UPI0036787E42
MSIFDKVKEMLGGEKSKSVPEQGGPAAEEAAGSAQAGDVLSDFKNKAEEAAMSGIDEAAKNVDEATGGKYTDQINKGAEKAKDVADKIDGEQG